MLFAPLIVLLVFPFDYGCKLQPATTEKMKNKNKINNEW